MVQCSYGSATLPHLFPIDFGTLLGAETCGPIFDALFDRGPRSVETCSVANAEVHPTTCCNGVEQLGGGCAPHTTIYPSRSPTIVECGC